MADRGIDITKLSANSLEYFYVTGRVNKRDVTAWIRMSAKLSGRIYQAGYIPLFDGRGRQGSDALRLRRREDLENKLFAKKGGYWKRDRFRDRSSRRRRR